MHAMTQKPSMYDAVMVRLRERSISQRAIAEGSGVPFSTVCKIVQGRTKAPSVHHVQSIYNFFEKVEAGEITLVDQSPMVERAA